MNVDELRQELKRQEVDLWVDGDLLRFRARQGSLNGSLLRELRRHKNRMIEILKSEASGELDEDRFQDLSIGQQALYFLHSTAPMSPAYNVASAARIRSSVDVQAMQKAFASLISRHDSLRTTFEIRQGRPGRRVHAHGDLDFCQIEATGWDEQRLSQAVHREYRQPFDLAGGPLLRVRLFTVGEKDHVFLMALHHIVFDSWSLWLVQDEFRLLYEQYTGGQTALLPKLPATYDDFVREQDKLQRNGRGELLWQYWKKRLAGELTPPDLPLDRPRPDRPSLRGASHAFRVPSALSARLRKLAAANGATPFMVMLAVFKTLLHRYTGQEDLIVGTTTSGRSKSQFTRLVGYFVNTLAIRTNMSGQTTFSELLARVKIATLGAIEHQDFPFPLLVDRLNPRRDTGRLPICTVMFGLQKPQQFNEVTRLFDEEAGHIDWGGLEVHPFELHQQEGQFDLTLEMFETNDSFLGTLKYDVDLFDAATAQRMGRRFLRLAEAVVDDPDRPLVDYDIMSEEDHERVLGFASTGTVETPADPRVHRLFELQAQRTPDRTAAVADDRSLTYDRLNRRANRLARLLQDRGVELGTLVACRLHRGIDVPVAILAILKAGGTYVPLDATSPEQRVQQMTRDCGAGVVLAHARLSFACDASQQVVLLDREEDALAVYSDANLELDFRGDTPAYVIYTSGSTGVPKGVCVSHRAFAEHVTSIREVFGLVPGDRMLQFSNLTFDPSLEQMFAPWSIGATVVFRGDELWAPNEFWQVVRRHELTVVNVPPAYFKQCSNAIGPNDDTASLRLLIIGGDLFPAETLGTWKDRGVRILNAYGPTEAVVTATVYDATDHDPSRSRVPIGRPKPGLVAHVLDQRGRHTPIGIPGELCLGGSMLADGYLGDAELTSSKFVPAPPSDGSPGDGPFSEHSGARMYRTGDLARWTPDGNLEFLGRRDRQIKIHGFRVETGEIESVLNRFPCVTESFVQTRNDSHGDTYLVAWFAFSGDEEPEREELGAMLRSRLPSYMVPRHFVAVEQLPTDTSGKVDAKALPDPPTTRPANRDYVPPRNDKEQLWADIWSNVLDVDSVGIHDDFFDLGGGSLTSLRIVAEADDAGLNRDGNPLKPELLFEYPTVSEIAAFLES